MYDKIITVIHDAAKIKFILYQSKFILMCTCGTWVSTL